VLFGPLDVLGANDDLTGALLQTAVVLTLFWLLLGYASRYPRGSTAAALVLVALDLGWANGWMVTCAGKDLWRDPSAVASTIQGHEGQSPQPGPYRAARYSLWLPGVWQYYGSSDRIAEAAAWDWHTLWPKHNLGWRIPMAEVNGTMMPYEYEVFLWAAKQLEPTSPRGGMIPLPLARYAILPGQYGLPNGTPLMLPEAVSDVSLWYNPQHLPRAWIVHYVEILPPLDSLDPDVVWQRTQAAVSRDLLSSALVETRDESLLGRQQPVDENSVPSEESCRIAYYDPLRVELDVELMQPGLVILADQFYPGWRLEVEAAGAGSKKATILKTNRVMRGAWLPEGRHRLIYRYQPASFTWGAILSALSCIVLAFFGAGLVLRNLRAR
jgi:hypothetical protein